MLRMFHGGIHVRFDSIPLLGKREDRMTGGLIGSSLLHAAAALLFVLGLPRFVPQHELIMSVELVQLGEKTVSPFSQDMATLPQEQAKEDLKSPSATGVPVPQPPSSRMILHQPDKAVPAPVNGSKPAALPVAKARQQPLPTDDLSARLKQLSQLRQPAAQAPPDPRQQKGSGASNVTAAADTGQARNAAYGVKDFIRAQVERRLNTDCNTLKCGDWVVSIHIVLRSDGSISRAEIVDDPRYDSDSAYRDFAISARDAVLLSSPLTIPPGDYDIAKDIVVDFSSRQISQ